MTRLRVFVTRKIPEKGQSMVTDFCDAEIWLDEMPPSREVLLEKMRGLDGLLCLLTDRVDGEVMDAAGLGLKVISNHAVGVDNIDLLAATRRGIPVGNTPGILTDATADFAFALLLAAARRVVEGERYVRTGRWKTWGPSLLLGTDVFGATLGIIGYGRIGRALARRASGFDMRILYYDPSLGSLDPLPPGTPVTFETLLGEADFVSLHTPLTPETYHLIDDHALALIKPSAVLINTARGPVVDPQALYRALKKKQIFAAALDVTDPEPIPLDSPLLKLDNLIVVPHIASASRTTREKMATMAAENLIAGLKGERLPHCVNPQVYAST